MNLQRINPPIPEFTFTCSKCMAKTSSKNGYADLDGKPFEDYYCSKCKDEIEAIPNKNTYHK